jgi:hypothetical protein
MIAVKVCLLFVLLGAAVAQDVWKGTTYSDGTRVNGKTTLIIVQIKYEALKFLGDKFLFFAHRISPFYLTKSNFETTLEYNGEGKIARITQFEVVTYGVS